MSNQLDTVSNIDLKPTFLVFSNKIEKSYNTYYEKCLQLKLLHQVVVVNFILF